MQRFEAPDLRARLEAMDEAALDALPFGVIRLSPEGVVRFYSATEAEQSGFRTRTGMAGRDFFSDVAPCMVQGVKTRFDAAGAGDLDMEIGWVGDFRDRDRDMRPRLLAGQGGRWICIARD